MRFVHCALGAAFALAATMESGRSHACGGCFQQPTVGQESKATVVLAHRMALSLSPSQTVLWDQIQYAGAPDAFAWVLPVKPGARLELSTDAWFETLDTTTSTTVLSPPVACDFPDSGFDGDEAPSRGCGRGCAEEAGAGSGGEGWGGTGGAGGTGNEVPPVVVVHQETVGPYEVVTLHANVPNALPGWLSQHGFVIDDGVKPIIDTYTAEGFDFIAMRLVPGQGIDRMKPVRVVMPGASPTLPLRMVAAGTGANVGLTLYVISEGRYQAQNFENAEVDTDAVSWDFDREDSNYGELRKEALARAGGRTWITSYARRGALLEATINSATGLVENFEVGLGTYLTIAEAYVRQAIDNGEGTSDVCVGRLVAIAKQPSGKVVEACDHGFGGGGGAGSGGAGGAGAGGDAQGGAGNMGTGGSGPVPPCKMDEIDGRRLACGSIDDVAVALVGLHPRDVWITRLESSLPRAALTEDLTISAAGTEEVSNWIRAADFTGDPCAELGGTLLSRKRPIRGLGGPGKAMIARGRTPSLAAAVTITLVAIAAARRLSRRAGRTRKI